MLFLITEKYVIVLQSTSCLCNTRLIVRFNFAACHPQSCDDFEKGQFFAANKIKQLQKSNATSGQKQSGLYLYHKDGGTDGLNHGVTDIQASAVGIYTHNVYFVSIIDHNLSRHTKCILYYDMITLVFLYRYTKSGNCYLGGYNQ